MDGPLLVPNDADRQRRGISFGGDQKRRKKELGILVH